MVPDPSASRLGTPAEFADKTNRLPLLSARQMQILQLTADGLSNGAIAQQLHVSEETVRTHMRRTTAKLHARNRAHAVAIGLRSGMIT